MDIGDKVVLTCPEFKGLHGIIIDFFSNRETVFFEVDLLVPDQVIVQLISSDFKPATIH